MIDPSISTGKVLLNSFLNYCSYYYYHIIILSKGIGITLLKSLNYQILKYYQ
jgi:hypothetical protein